MMNFAYKWKPSTDNYTTPEKVEDSELIKVMEAELEQEKVEVQREIDKRKDSEAEPVCRVAKEKQIMVINPATTKSVEELENGGIKNLNLFSKDYQSIKSFLKFKKVKVKTRSQNLDHFSRLEWSNAYKRLADSIGEGMYEDHPLIKRNPDTDGRIFYSPYLEDAYGEVGGTLILAKFSYL